jgi:hypothetical protein
VDHGPFSSTLLDASDDLTTFAFGGPEICDPCFADGSAGMPVRLPSGELVQGMAGSQSHPDAEEAGFIADPLSADGNHLVFGSTSAFAAGATEGQATLYERDLEAPAPNTEIISTGSDGNPLSGAVGELAISADGSRVVVAEEVDTDAAGNPLWHPYLHIRGSSASVDLAEGTTSGVYFNGMTADGSAVFFSTVDAIPVDQPFADEDESIDIYRAEVDGSGNAVVNLLTVDSTGAVSNADDCEAPGDPDAWNAIDGEGKCNAVAFAGGAGLAKNDGSFYFVSPEQLAGGEGIANQANLYVVRPGGPPHPEFVALMDSSLEKAGPPSVQRPLLTEKFAGAEIDIPGEVAVDQSTGDVYAFETSFGEGGVYRYHADGTAANFSAGPSEGTNRLSGFFTELGSAGQIAVDNSAASQGTPLQNALYVPHSLGVHVFAQSGELLGTLNGSGTATGSYSRACGVAVDQATGAVYVADRGGYIWQYTPNGPAGPIVDSDYTVQGIATSGVKPCSIAVDGIGNVYAVNEKPWYEGAGAVYRWSASDFGAQDPPPSVAGVELGASAAALAADHQTNELYVNTGKFIRVFDSSGAETENFGSGKLVCAPEFSYLSRGVAINVSSKHVYASCTNTWGEKGFKGSLREWGYSQPPYVPVDNPAIVHAVEQPEVHTWGDFQVTPDARYAAFSTVVPLKPGYDNGGRYEVYRLDGPSLEMICVSCDPTGSQASTDSVLPPSGLGLLRDGRVFFNTGESLTLNDTNGKLDAYEWSPKRDVTGGCAFLQGCQQLISSGTSAYASGMLGVTSDGRDAYFFARDSLVPGDRNGEAMRIYDARENGGFFVIPPPPPCAASDECHGPSSQAQAPPQIGSFKGRGGQFKSRSTRRCKKGLKRQAKKQGKKQGRCVKKKRRKQNKRKGARRASHSTQQGGSR